MTVIKQFVDGAWEAVVVGAKGDTGAQGPAGAAVSILAELENEAALPATGEPGDSYLIAGDLWVWEADTSTWTNLGPIQGPQGEPGADGIGYPATGDLTDGQVAVLLRDSAEVSGFRWTVATPTTISGVDNVLVDANGDVLVDANGDALALTGA